MLTTLLLIGLVRAAAAAPDQASAPVAPQAEPVLIDRIAAIVNREVITLSEVQEALLQQSAGDAAVAERLLTPRALREQLRRLIDGRLQAQAAEQRGLTVTDLELGQAIGEIKSRNGFDSDEQFAAALATERMTLEQYRERLRREILTAKLINREVRAQVVVSDEELRDYYADHAGEFSLPERVKLRQIVFFSPPGSPARADGRARVLDVLAQLRNGADFDQLARRYSEGPEAREGGELGWFSQGSLVGELDRAAFTLQDGQASEPIESPAGWHLLTVEAREGNQRRPFEQVKEALREQRLEEKIRQRYEEWFLELRQQAYVDIRL